MLGEISFHRGAHGRRGVRRISSRLPTWRTCWCAKACLEAYEVGGIVRAASESHRRLSTRSREELRRAGAAARRAPMSCSSRGPGSSRRCPMAARRWPACATSSRRLATCWPRLAHEVRPRLLRPLSARRGPRSDHCSLRHAGTAGRIVETESYHMDEPARHAHGSSRAAPTPCSGRRAWPTCTSPMESTRC